MFKCMSAILHLGNVDFTEDDSERAHVSSTSELVVTAVSYFHVLFVAVLKVVLGFNMSGVCYVGVIGS